MDAHETKQAAEWIKEIAVAEQEARASERAKHRAALGKAQQRFFEARKDEAKMREERDIALSLIAEVKKTMGSNADGCLCERPSGPFCLWCRIDKVFEKTEGAPALKAG